MTLLGLYITKASKIEKERSERKMLLEKLVSKYKKANDLWNRVISGLLWENHNMKMELRR